MKTIRDMVDCLENDDRESFRKILFKEVTNRIENRLEQKKSKISREIIVSEMAPKAPSAGGDEEALHVDPNMAKEFFLFDIEYKGHTITVKSLGTGIGKPLVSYIDGDRFEIFTDKEIAEKESKSAIDRMVSKKIDNVKDLRKTTKQINQEKIDQNNAKSEEEENDK
jgi:acyl dehydratase